MTPEKVLTDAGIMYAKKRLEYGDSWERVGRVLFELLRIKEIQGGEIWRWHRIHLVTMIVVKLTRFCVGLEKGEHHKDSTKDLVVYAAMLDSLTSNE